MADIVKILEDERKARLKCNALNIERKDKNMVLVVMLKLMLPKLLDSVRNDREQFNLNIDEKLNYTVDRNASLWWFLRHALLFHGGINHTKIQGNVLDEMANKLCADRNTIEQFQHTAFSISLSEDRGTKWAKAVDIHEKMAEGLQLDSISLNMDIVHRQFKVIDELCIASIVVEGKEDVINKGDEQQYYRVGLYAFGYEQVNHILEQGSEWLTEILYDLCHAKMNNTEYRWINDKLFMAIERDCSLLDML